MQYFCVTPYLIRIFSDLPRRTFTLVLLAGAVMGNCAWASVGAGPDTLAVVFPDIGEPYRKVFTEIIDGVEQQARGKVRSVAVGPAQDAAELQTTLRRTGVRTVIALGRQGLKTAGAFDALGVVVGGISALPEQERFRGISLMPDPALLFTWLKTLVPGVKRVIVVYSPQQSAGAVRLARDAARAQGLELVALEAQDLAAAVRRYETAFAGIDGKRDAVWLPQDAVTADDATVLPLVLRESWNRNVALFSSSILHVKKRRAVRALPRQRGARPRAGRAGPGAGCHSEDWPAAATGRQGGVQYPDGRAHWPYC